MDKKIITFRSTSITVEIALLFLNRPFLKIIINDLRFEKYTEDFRTLSKLGEVDATKAGSNLYKAETTHYKLLIIITDLNRNWERNNLTLW